LPLCRERGVAVIANGPLGSGRLFRSVQGGKVPDWARDSAGGRAQFFAKYLLGHDACTGVIPGTGDPDHAADLLAAGEGRLPRAHERRRMAETLAAL
jgi:aryl-alcohol dehydrogenase-like predicted oxidoreductase